MPFIKGLDIRSFGVYLFLLSVKVVPFIPCVYILVLSWRGYPAPAMCSWVGGVVTCLSEDNGHRELRWGLWFLLSVIRQKHEEPHDSSESQSKHTTVPESRERQTHDCRHLRNRRYPWDEGCWSLLSARLYNRSEPMQPGHAVSC